MSDWIDVIPADELSPGEYTIVELDDIDVAVFNVDGEFHAIADICTHDGEILTGGPVEGDIITCPRHGATFCIRTGEALTPPAYEPVMKFPVRVVDRMVQLRDHRTEY